MGDLEYLARYDHFSSICGDVGIHPTKMRRALAIRKVLVVSIHDLLTDGLRENGYNLGDDTNMIVESLAWAVLAEETNYKFAARKGDLVETPKGYGIADTAYRFDGCFQFVVQIFSPDGFKRVFVAEHDLKVLSGEFRMEFQQRLVRLPTTDADRFEPQSRYEVLPA